MNSNGYQGNVNTNVSLSIDVHLSDETFDAVLQNVEDNIIDVVEDNGAQ